MTEAEKELIIVKVIPSNNEVVRTQIMRGDEENPEVIKRVYSNGKEKIIRVVNPERSKPLPIFVFWDETVTPKQQAIIKKAFEELSNFLGDKLAGVEYYGNWAEENHKNPDGSLIPYKSIEWQLKTFINKSRNQIDASDASRQMFSDPNQLTHPHWEVIFTNTDLFLPETNFVIGAANTDLGTIMSLSRLERIKDETLRGETQKTEIFHEFGHVLALPTNRRSSSQIEQSIGNHCMSPACSMQQGLIVPDDWIKFTNARLKNGGEPFCKECKADLNQKFDS